MASKRNSEPRLEKAVREETMGLPGYEAVGRAMREKSAKLKSLRLAKEQADAKVAAEKKRARKMRKA